jgi:hypothetical protein
LSGYFLPGEKHVHPRPAVAADPPERRRESRRFCTCPEYGDAAIPDCRGPAGRAFVAQIGH